MKILMICHRIPFPPNKGEKIRSFHILKHLAASHEIYLASLIDDPADIKANDILAEYVQWQQSEYISPRFKKIFSGLRIFFGKSISVGYFYSRRLQKKIDALLEKVEIDAILCVCSPTAEYLFKSNQAKLRLRRALKVIDFVDVDSAKWHQLAAESSIPQKWIYEREACSLKCYENNVSNVFDHLLVVTESEKSMLSNSARSKAISMRNGVDLDFYSPRKTRDDKINGPTIVFTGVMDYKPNIDGVIWFSKKVFPIVREKYKNAQFWIVGSRPSVSVKNLTRAENGIHVTGFVEDVRPYLEAADICVAPLRIARGIQNKVLEAMAMAKPVVATSGSLLGIVPEREIEIAVSVDRVDEFAGAIIMLVEQPTVAKEFGQKGRAFVERHHDWKNNLKLLSQLFQ